MAVRQCPRCELRFRDEREVRAHLVDDHKVDPDQLGEHHPTPGGSYPPPRRPGSVDREQRRGE